MQDEKDLREDAKQLLRAAYERQVAGGGRVTQLDLAAGAEERSLSPTSSHFNALVDYMEVMGWAEVDVFARSADGATARRITARGLEVVREARDQGRRASSRFTVGARGTRAKRVGTDSSVLRVLWRLQTFVCGGVHPQSRISIQGYYKL